MSKTLIDEMVNRFLSWKLPNDFAPDAGISFEAEYNVEYMAKQGKPPCRHEPVGTNLLNADQARQMIEHMVGDMLKPLSDYAILRMHKNLPIEDVEGVGDLRFEKIVRCVERSHGITG